MNTNAIQKPNYFRPALSFGFLSAVFLWCAWFVTHIPGAEAPAPVVAALLLVFLAVCLSQLGKLALPKPWLAGLLAGFICALINLLLLGSYLVEQPESTAEVAEGAAGLKPDAAVIAIVFLGLCAVLGAVSAVLGAQFGSKNRSAAKDPADIDWLAFFSKITVLATIPVLLVGGIVTSADAGLAVPDWPGSYGANMFLYPFALMADPRIFLEHTHRLFGSLVGLATLALSIQTLFSCRSGLIKGASVGLLLLVILQGVMGGQGRVVGQNPYFGAIHGITAQIFFALVVAFAMVLATKKSNRDQPAFGRAGPMTAILLGCVLLQLMFGATYRHLSAQDDPASGVGHILLSHVGFSFVVLILTVVTGSMLRGTKGENGSFPRARIRVGKAMIHVIGLQFLLGWGAFAYTGNDRGKPPTADQLSAEQVPLIETLVTMAHQLNGAFVLALATLAVVLWIGSLRSALSDATVTPSP